MVKVVDGETDGLTLGDGTMGINGFTHEGGGVLAFFPLAEPCTVGSKCTPKEGSSAKHLILFKNIKAARVLQKKLDQVIKKMEEEAEDGIPV